jgi:hypothetical protein
LLPPLLCHASGLPDFFSAHHTKTGKIYQMATKCTKWSLNIPFGSKINKMALKIPTFFIARPSKIYPNLDFLFENIPSGNTAMLAREKKKRKIWLKPEVKNCISGKNVKNLCHKSRASCRMSQNALFSTLKILVR